MPGPEPRSPYHHGDLREALVGAAEEAVRERGADGLALRDLARRVGVSHNAAYRHFVHRDDLVAEVSGRVMARLVESMQRRLSAVRTQNPVLRARRRLAQTGRGYVDFALAEPGLFRLAFTSSEALATVSLTPDRDPYGLLGAVLDDLVAVGLLAPDARPGAEITCWSAMHGFATLCVDGALDRAVAGSRADVLEEVLVSLDRSYAATTGTAVSARDLRTG